MAPERPATPRLLPGSDRVARLRALAGRSARSKRGRFLIEGPQAVREAVAAGAAEDVYLTSDAWDRHRDIAAGARYPHLADDRALAEVSSDAQGVLAVGPLPTLSLADLPDVALVAVLVRVQDPGNIGTLIRVADAAGADAVVLTPGCADPFAPKAVRSTAGSLFHLPVLASVPLGDAVAWARSRSLSVLAADGEARLTLPVLQARGGSRLERAAWLFGNEAGGLDPREQALADEAVAVPIYGAAESLNVAAAAALCLYASAFALREEA